MTLRAGNTAEYIGALSGEKVSVNGGNIVVNVKANGGDIWLPVTPDTKAAVSPVAPFITQPQTAVQPAPSAPESTNAVKEIHTETNTAKPADNSAKAEPVPSADNCAQANDKQAAPADSQDFESGKIAGLQEAILAIMEKNGPVTDQMRRDVEANVYHDSLIAWIKSFR